MDPAADPNAEEEIDEYASAPTDENQWLWMDLLPNATANYSLGGSFQVGTFQNQPTMWVKLCLRLPENHINMSAEHEKQFHMSIYIQFNDMNMRLLSLKSFQNVECRKRGYFQNVRIEQTKNFMTEYRQGLSLVSSCGTNLLPLDFDIEARLVTGN